MKSFAPLRLCAFAGGKDSGFRPLQYVAEGAERFEDAGDLILALPIRAHEATPQQLLQNRPHQD
jgi:hypothetical protein